MLPEAGDGNRTGSIGGGTVLRERCVAGEDTVLETGPDWAFVDVPAALPCHRWFAVALSHCQPLIGADVGPCAGTVSRLRGALVYGGPLLQRVHLVVFEPVDPATSNWGLLNGAGRAWFPAQPPQPQPPFGGLEPSLLCVLLGGGCRLLGARLR